MIKNLTMMVVVVVLVVAFLKMMFKLKGRKAKAAAWVTALVTVFIVYANQGMFDNYTDWLAMTTVIFLLVINSIMVTFLAMKSYEEIIEPLQKKQVPEIFKEGTS